MPLILPDSADIIKVWGKFDATHENVIAHVVGQAIIGDLWFFGTKVALYRYFGVAGDIASGVVYGKCQVGKKECLQLCLVHVEWFLEIAAQRGNQDLVYFELHDEIGKPPALGTLYAVFGAVTFCKAFLHDAGGRDGSGSLCLLGGQGSLYGGRERSGGGQGEAFSPKDTDRQETCARGGLAIWVCWGGGCGAGWLVGPSGESSRGGFLCELAKSFEHQAEWGVRQRAASANNLI